MYVDDHGVLFVVFPELVRPALETIAEWLHVNMARFDLMLSHVTDTLVTAML